MNTKKLLSLVLVLVLALSLSVVSLAADEPAYEEWTSTDSLPTSGAYKLMENVNVTTEFSNAPTIKGSLVLDLNGKTVTITGGSFNAITVNKGGSLTIEDNSAEQTGKITNGDNASSINTLLYANGGSLNIKGGTIEGSGGNVVYVNASGSASITGGEIVNRANNNYALFINSGSSVTVEGGTVKNTANGGKAVYVNSNGSFTLAGGNIIQDCKYSSSAAIYANNSAESITISGGNVESNSMGVYSAFAPVEITGGTIDAATYAFQTRYATVAPADGSTVTVNAGTAVLYTFSGSENALSGGDFNSPVIVKEYTSGQSTVTTVTGGEFDVSPAEYVPEDSAAVKYTSDGSTVYYVGDDIASASASAVSGDKIEVITGSVDITINVDGVDVSNSGSGTVNVNGEAVTEGGITTHIHDAEPVAAKEATCTEDGNIAYWYCEGCGKYFKDEALKEEITKDKTVIKASGHDAKPVAAKEATCTEDGNIAYWYCENCGKYFKDEALKEETTKDATIVKATGHENVKHVEAKPATTKEEGNIEYWYCEDCDRYFKDEALKVEIKKEDTVIKVTGEEKPDEKPEDPKDPSVPQTGDSSVMTIVLAVMALSAAGAAAVTVLKSRKNHN